MLPLETFELLFDKIIILRELFVWFLPEKIGLKLSTVKLSLKCEFRQTCWLLKFLEKRWRLSTSR
jgi:hypothetical protein